MDTSGRFVLPPPASSTAHSVDAVYYFIQWVSVFFFLLVIGLMVAFVIRYRRRSETDTTPNLSHHTLLELTWTIIPLIIVIVIFFMGFRSYMNLRVAPADTLQVYVTAQKWAWHFDYPTGVSATELVVPQGRPVKLIMSSEDVIHGFFAPDFRIKQDVLPNRYTSVWFSPEQLGEYRINCTQYCGMGHSAMLSTIKVVSPTEYKAWIDAGGMDPSSTNLPLPKLGEALYKSQQCATCHTLDGSPKAGGGPSYKGLFGSEVKLSDGSTIKADEAYLRESILNPGKQVVAGYQPVMPAFPSLKERQINALVEFIKTVQ